MKRTWIAGMAVFGLMGVLFLAGCYPPPIAYFTFVPEEPIIGETVVFDGSHSRSRTGHIISWEWKHEGRASGRGEELRYVFEEAGSHLVTLRVTDDRGRSGQTDRIVTVYQRNIGARIDYWPHSPAVGQKTQFWATANYIFVPQGLVVEGFEYRWQIEGVTYHGQNAEHVFRQAGEHWPTLWVWDDQGNETEVATKVIVSPPQPREAEVVLSGGSGRIGEAIPVHLTLRNASALDIGGQELFLEGLAVEGKPGIHFSLILVWVEVHPGWVVDWGYEDGRFIILASRTSETPDLIVTLWLTGYEPGEFPITIRGADARDGRGYPIPSRTKDGRVTIRR